MVTVQKIGEISRFLPPNPHPFGQNQNFRHIQKVHVTARRMTIFCVEIRTVVLRPVGTASETGAVQCLPRVRGTPRESPPTQGRRRWTGRVAASSDLSVPP